MNRSEKYDFVNEEYLSNCKEGLVVTEMSFSQAVYLLSVIRSGASEDLEYIIPHEYYEIPLSPCESYDEEILMQLYRADLLFVHPGSNKHENVIVVKGDPPSFRFYPLDVHWLIQLVDLKKPEKTIEELEKILSAKKWPASWSSEVNALRTRIALEESLQYLRYVLSEHGFNFNVGEKTTQTVKSLLNDFSVAQIYNFCWRAAKDAAAFYLRSRVPKKQAANIVPGAIQRMFEKAIVEGWEVKPFQRNFNVPQCMVSQVLYNTTLKIGDEGFNRPVPREDEK